MVHNCRVGRHLIVGAARVDSLAQNGEPSGELPAGPTPTAAGTPGPTLWVPVYVVVLVGDDESLVPGDHRIYDQMITLNKAFSATNDTLKHVPSTGSKYDFRGVIGNPCIQFDLMSVETRKITYKVDGVDAVFKGEPQIKDAINFFIANIQTDDGTLGESKLGGTCVVVDYKTVGGAAAPAISSKYDSGITAVHEFGHLFNLFHNFDIPCTQNYSDVPPQRYPNLRATLTTIAGAPNGKNDNVSLDCKPPAEELSIDKPYSCSGDPCNASGEQFMNYMDYGEDRDMVMFSAAQAAIMYAHVLNTGLGRTTSSPGITITSVERIVPMSLWLFCVVVASAIVAAMLIWIIVIAAAA